MLGIGISIKIQYLKTKYKNNVGKKSNMLFTKTVNYLKFLLII